MNQPSDVRLGIELGLYQHYLETGETVEKTVFLISLWREKRWKELDAEIQKQTGKKISMLQDIADFLGGEIV